MGKLTQSRRTGTVADYIDQFLVMLSWAGPLLPK